MTEIVKTTASNVKTAPSKVVNTVRLGIARADVQSIRVVDTDLVVILKNGKRIVIPDGAVRAMMDPAFTVSFQDVDILGASVIQNAGPLEINPISMASLGEGDTALAASGSVGDTAVATGSTSTASAAPFGSQASGQAGSLAQSDVVASTTATSTYAGATALPPPVEAAALGSAIPLLAGLSPMSLAVGAASAVVAVAATTTAPIAVAAAAINPYLVSGVVVLGPVTQGVTIKAFDKSGNMLYSGSSDSSGRFLIKITSGYTGAILIVASDANGATSDYMDEASSKALSLGTAVVRGAGVADGTQDLVINITPLTELVVRALGVAVGSTSLSGVNSSTVISANKSIAQQFGLSNATTDPIAPVVDAQGDSATGNNYGKVLASLSGLDLGTSTKALFSGLDPSIVSSATEVANGTSTSPTAIQNAVAVSTQNFASPVLSSASSGGVSGQVTLNKATPTATVKVAYSWAAPGDSIHLSDGNGVKVGVLHIVTQAEVVAGYATLTVTTSDFATQSSSQVLKVGVKSAISTQVTSPNQLSVAVDTVVPSTPVVAATATDLNATTAAAGAVKVTAEAGASVAVTFTDAGGHTVTKTVTGNGTTPVLVTLTPAEQATLSSEGVVAVSAIATDTAGNPSLAGTGGFTLDRLPPGLPVVVAAGSIENAATAAAGAVSITAELGASVAVTFTDAGGHTVTKTVIGNGATPVLVQLTPQDLLTLSTPGTVTTSAITTDVAGNPSAAVTGSFDLYSIAPTTSVLTTAFSADTGNTPAELTDFITKTAAQTITGTLSANTVSGEFIQVSLDNGLTWITATHINGTNTFSYAGTLAGSSTLKVRVSDAVGNFGPTATQAYEIDTAPPTLTVTNVSLSADTGFKNNDLITKTDVQTISATLSGNLSAGDILLGSTDGGTSWTDITSKVIGTGITWNNVTLSGSSSIVFKVKDRAGNEGSNTGSTVYLLDATAPVLKYDGSIIVSQGATVAQEIAGKELLPTGSLVQLTEVNAVAKFELNVSIPGLLASSDLFLTLGVNTPISLAGVSLSGTITYAGVKWSWSATTPTYSSATTPGTITLTFTPVDSSSNIAIATSTANLTSLLQALKVQSASGALGTNTFTYVVTDSAGNTSAPVVETFAVVGEPTAQVTGISALSTDLGTAGDFITGVASQTVTGTFGGVLRGAEQIQVSADGGTTWVTATVTGAGTWSSSAVTLVTGTGNITTRIINVAGEVSAAVQATRAYTLESAPLQTASVSAVTDAVGVYDYGTSATGLVVTSTNDTRPVISGTVTAALSAGQVLNVYDGSVLMGAATVTTANGVTTWTYRPATELSGGSHSFSAKVASTTSGLIGTAANSQVINVESLSTLTLNSVPLSEAGITVANSYLQISTTTIVGKGRVANITSLAQIIAIAAGKDIGVASNLTPASAFLLDTTTTPGAVTFWVEWYDKSLLQLKAVQVKLTDDANGNIVAQALQGKYINTAFSNFGLIDFNSTTNTNIQSASVATASSTGSLGVNSLKLLMPTYSSASQPTLTGNLYGTLLAGETISILEGTTSVGTVTVSGTTWSATTTGLSAGVHDLTVRVTAANGTVVMERHTFVDTTAPVLISATASVTDVTDNVGATSTGGYFFGDATGAVTANTGTNDARPVIRGSVSGSLQTGEVVNVYDGATLLGTATVTGATWTYTPTAALAAGSHNLSAKVVNAVSGTTGPASAVDNFLLNEQSMSAISVPAYSGPVVGSNVGRYVMIFVTGEDGNWAVGELEVYSKGANGVTTNIALGKSFLNGGQISYATSYPSTAIDANPSTAYQTGSLSYRGAWLQLDLGADYVLSSIKVVNQYLNYSLNSYIFYSRSSMQAAADLNRQSYDDNAALAALQATATGKQITSSSNTTSGTPTTRTFDVPSTPVIDRPTLNGVLGAALLSGERVEIFHDVLGSLVSLGVATVIDKAWTFTLSPSQALTPGSHTLYAKLMNGSTVEMAQAILLNVTSSADPTATASITTVTDNVASLLTGAVVPGTSTDDARAVISGTVSATLATGQVVNVYDNLKLLGTATVIGTNWTYAPTADLASGLHSFTAKVTNSTTLASSVASAAVVINEQSMSAISAVSTLGLATAANVGRYVLLYVSNTCGNWNVSEIQVMSNGINVALGKYVAVGQQGAWPYGNTASSNAVDGNPGTLFGSNNTGTYGAWLQVDLGKNYLLNSISVLGQNLNNSPNSYIFYSTTSFASGGNAAPALATLLSTAAGAQITNSNGGSVNGSYVPLGNGTNDKPVLSGELSAPLLAGEVLDIYLDGGTTALGSATVTWTGTKATWTYTPTVALTAGTHSIYAKLTTSGGTVTMVQSINVTVSGDVTPGQLASVTGFTDAVGNNAFGSSATGAVANGGSTDDASGFISGTLSGVLVTGQAVNVYDNGVLLGKATITGTGTTWTYTPTTPLAAGAHSFTAKVIFPIYGTAGAVSASTWAVQLQSVALGVTTDSGINAGVLANGAITGDQTPTLTITLGVAPGAGERVAVYDNGTFLGLATGSGTSWTFTPVVSLSSGGHVLVAQVEATTGGSATTGRAVAVFNLTVSAQALLDQVVTLSPLTDTTALNGSATGVLAAGSSTDDSRPSLTGTISAGLKAGQQLAVYDNGNLLGYAKLAGLTWSFRPDNALDAGSHGLSAKVIDVATGLFGTATAVQTLIEQSVTVNGLTPGAGVFNKGSNAWAVGSGSVTLTGTLGAALATGESLAVFDNGGAYLGTAVVTGTSWTYTPTTALTAGVHSLVVQVQSNAALNDAGYNAGRANSVATSVTVDSTVPTAVVSITGVKDNVGAITGNVASNGFTDDAKPVISGTLDVALSGANQVVQVFDNGALLGNATVNGLNWTFTPSVALTSGNNALMAKVVNLATGVSASTSIYEIDLQSISLTSVIDHTGALTGNVLAATGTTTTDDGLASFGGSLGHALASGQVINVYDNGLLLGVATTSTTATGTTWSYTPGVGSTALAQGTHNLSVQVELSSSPGNALVSSSPKALFVQSADPVSSAISGFKLALSGANQALDLTVLSSVQLQEVNLVNATNTLSVKAASVLLLGITDAYTSATGWSGALVAGDKQLVIDGALGGKVKIETGWTQSGTVTNGALIYNSYTNGFAQLLIDNHLTVQPVL